MKNSFAIIGAQTLKATVQFHSQQGLCLFKVTINFNVNVAVNYDGDDYSVQ